MSIFNKAIKQSLEDEGSKKTLIKKGGKTLVKNKKTGNVYFVKNVNDEKHDTLDKNDLIKMKKSGELDSKPTSRPEETESEALELIKKHGMSEPKDKEIRTKIRKELEAQAKNNNHEVQYRRLFGSTYVIGVDPYDNRVAYDWDGSEYGFEEFKDLLKERRKVQSRLNNIHKNDLYLKSIEKVDDGIVDKLKSGDVSFEFLSDNQELKNKLTRSYPVVNYNGRKLIVGGRFSGHYLEDMINQAGRHVAGTGYIVDDDGKTRKIEYKGEDSSKFRVRHEPYATVNADGNLNIIIPWGDSERGKALRKLTDTVKTLENVGRNSWTIPPEDFETINEALEGMAMSDTASSIVTEMIEQKHRQIRAENEKTYSHITPKEIVGFKHKLGDKEWDFMSHQKKAIDVVTKSKKGTTIGFGTGGGKSITAIGILQQWRNDGTLKEDGKNGKAIIVAEPSLKGNFPGEVATFMEEDAAKEFLGDVEMVTYDDFRKNVDKYSNYGAIVFDEAQKLRTSTSKVGKTARNLDHPRKINLTASMLEKSPMDLYNLIDVSQNVVKDPKIRRKEKLKFIKTYCDSVGGKVIGLKSDMTSKRKFRDWVRTNSLYMDKTQVKEIDLPPVTPPERQTHDISMTGPIREKYEEMAVPIRDTLRRMAEKYNNNDLQSTELNQELSRVMGQLQKLRDFSNNPDNYVEGASNPKVDTTVDYVKDRISKNESSKTVTFTDNPELSSKTGKKLSEEVPYKKHVVALADRIEIWKNGEVIETFTSRSKLTTNTGKPVPKQDWQVHLIKTLQKDSAVSTFNLTSAYARGHNIQSADAVVHLDRDSWNNETMKQRTARAWRTGQKNPVDVKILDMTLDSGDSINEIQKYSMEIERKLFDDLISKSFSDKFKTNLNIASVEKLIKNRDNFEFMMKPTTRSSVSLDNADVTDVDKK